MTATQSETGFQNSVTTDVQGRYYLGSLPRGMYNLGVRKSDYQDLEIQGIELAVGAKHEEHCTLSRPTNAAEEAAVTRLLGSIPAVSSLPAETVASSVSTVVEENKILQLPLESRNIYSLFLMQPGVTSQGAIVRRGLSFSVHGQRVSGSNYLLDGVDNNNIVLTGPVAMTSAEATQEFRMVNSSFSAEHGRATGFVAQVATRSGSNRFHGTVFEYLANNKLNANTYENNAKGIEEPGFRRNQFGYSLGGPIRKSKTFFSNALEFSRLRDSRVKDFRLPSSIFIDGLAADSPARRLLTEIPPLPTVPSASNSNVGVTRVEVPDRIDTFLLNGRIDHYVGDGNDRLVARYTLSSSTEERQSEFAGYPSLQPEDKFRGHNTLLGWIHSFDAGHVNELRVGWSRERVWLPRPESVVPILLSFDGVSLPGNRRQSAQRQNNNVLQIADTFKAQRGRSAWTLGFEFRRNFSNGLTLGLQNEALGGGARFLDGFYGFPSLEAFGQGQAALYGLAVDRFSSGQLRLPNLERQYRSNEFALFIQNDLKLSRRLSLNLGLRYEFYGVPHNTDRSQDVNFYFGPGSTTEERLAAGELRSTDRNSGDLEGRLYRRDFVNFAPSIGLAWDLFGQGRTVMRAGYAVSLERVFDTLKDLRSNGQQVVPCFQPLCTPTFVIPAERLLPELDQDLGPGPVVQLDERLRTPYAQNWYVGVQHELTPNFLLEAGYAGSVGRKLISRDVINRFVVGVPPVNPEIADNTFLSTAGNSNYAALELGLRRRFSGGLQFQSSYTYGHAIDNQSDAFEGIRTGPGMTDAALTSFTRAFDSRLDRGNANFDQRHNFVFNAVWDVPTPQLEARWSRWLLNGWTLSVIGAYRTGFPVTVIGAAGGDPTTGLVNNRADFLGGPGDNGRFENPPPVAGGVQWLNPEQFRPAQGGVGNLGRGSIKSPGFWNYDFAVLKNVVLNERGTRLQFRAEFYNLFNHANLSFPETQYVDPFSFTGAMNPQFGQAVFGRNRTRSRFGDLPLENPSRRIQLALRLTF